EIVWRSVYRFHSRVVDRMRVGRVLLAGDCAHLMAPFGARGLNSGVADVENAAWKIVWVRRGWAPEGLLESYHDERHAAARENLEVTGATMRFLVPHDEADRVRRTETLARAATDPAARLAVDSGRLSEPFWYVDSPLTTPSATRPFAGRPARGTLAPAGPGVVVCEAPVSIAGSSGRLRALVRDGFLLLVGPAVDAAPVRAAAAESRGPSRVLALDEIDAGGTVREALAARPDEVWVIRPDAHVAAVLTAPGVADVAGALRRARGEGAA
ncbi:MAG TPA: FAD-dependent monooxygenase, partial [Vicinamibacteria bacterium]|nr:FAD-dependent monooxygenase [Vicinamibacteria bacterium]